MYKTNVKGENSMWCTLNVQDVMRKLRTNINRGLSEQEVKERQLKCQKLHRAI